MLSLTYIENVKVYSGRMSRMFSCHLLSIFENVTGNGHVRVAELAEVLEKGRRHQARPHEQHFMLV